MTQDKPAVGGQQGQGRHKLLSSTQWGELPAGAGAGVGAGHYTARNRFIWIIQCMQHRRGSQERCRCTVRVGGGLGEMKA